jgi:hypothetical protein
MTRSGFLQAAGRLEVVRLSQPDECVTPRCLVSTVTRAVVWERSS